MVTKPRVMVQSYELIIMMNNVQRAIAFLLRRSVSPIYAYKKSICLHSTFNTQTNSNPKRGTTLDRYKYLWTVNTKACICNRSTYHPCRLLLLPHLHTPRSLGLIRAYHH